MMSWLRANPRYAVLVLGTAVLPLLLVLYLTAGLLGLRAEYQAGIERLEPRVARLQGLLEREDELRQAASAVGSDVLDLVYPATDDHQAVSAMLQKNVREIFAAAGLVVSNSQILPVREEDGFDHIAIKFTASGDLPALDIALADINAYLPLLLIESIDVWPARASGRRGRDSSEQDITATVQVLALKARA
ncbi:type II secretion system protein GspM [Kineobactrum salinum]|uniref:General secretion pathway protein GspM n=1 Tax=Kineobactrum salinum TaxID=2708301 RepID=A0A6C0U2D6_9GAMM|nr:type II secretion system protein GspM [Kineobactrum salinum]QIB66320.1 general secretion pathway protein GspM [Kineobactrum salinum]